jgi:hypothetical protein
MNQSLKEQYRNFLKDSVRMTIDFYSTDQNRGLPPPPVEKPYSADAKRIKLVPAEEMKTISSVNIYTGNPQDC